jgi:hypothetical protein
VSFLDEINALTRLHRERCAPYRRVLDALGVPDAPAGRLEDVPALPVGLFKSHALRSVPEREVWKTLTSSGTTGQTPSRVYLDRETAQRQAAALARIMSGVLGPRRLPMILLDAPPGARDTLSARGAGFQGMSVLGRDHFHALDAGGALDGDGLRAWLARHGGAPFLIFGFTSAVWQHLPGAGVDLTNGILIHGGGWKRLADQAVSRQAFKERLRATVGLRRTHDFYGMVEQTGSVFLEHEDGLLHAPDTGAVVVRDPLTLLPQPAGEPGVLHVLSTLPTSYPGHSLLTEDLGVQRDGGFEVLGRLPRAELRGCSDVRP